MTQAQVDAHNLRHRFTSAALSMRDKLRAEKEKDLHSEIIAECKRRGWAFIHSRMDMLSTSSPGCPDFVIYGTGKNGTGAVCQSAEGRVSFERFTVDGAKIFSIECKTKLGKLSPSQLGFHHVAEKCGHKIHVVRSFAEFLEVIDGGKVEL